MNLRDMLDNIEEMDKPSSAVDQAVARATGVNVQRGERGREVIAKRQDQASKDVSQELKLLTFMKSNPNFLPVLKKAQDAMEKEQEMSNMADQDSNYRADRMDNVDMELDDSIDYDLDEVSMGQQRAARAMKQPGVSATRLQRSDDIISKRSDTASKDVANQLKLHNFMLSPEFTQSMKYSQMIELASKEMAAMGGEMEDVEVNGEFLESITDSLLEFDASVSLPILQQLMGGDKVLAQNARIALRNIDQDKGVNKRFMPALRKLLSKLTDILAMGGMGALAQYNQLHKTHSSGKEQEPGVGTGAIADPDAVQDVADYEPSEEEISQFAVDNGMPIVTQDQKDMVVSMIKDKMAKKQADDKEISDEPGERPKDNTGRPLNVQNDESIDELRKLAGLSEEKGMPSKSHVMDMCKKGMTFAEMCKMHPEADKDKLKAMVDKCKEEMKESVNEAKHDMPSKSECMKLCKDGKSKKQICDMYPDCDQDKLKAMIDDCMKEMKESVSEAMSDIYGQPKDLEGGVEFKQHKGNDKGQVSIEASAESMDDLHELLKLAGVEMSVDLHKKAEPEDSDDKDHDEPESHDDKEEPKDKKVMVISPQDASYSTDKEVLVNYLKDKLKKSIS